MHRSHSHSPCLPIFSLHERGLTWPRVTWLLSLVIPALLVGYLTSSLFGVGLTWAAELTDGIVAIVNKEIITSSELEAELVDERKRLRARFRGEELNRRLAQKKYDTLNALIERRIQLQEAEAKGITVEDEEMNQAIKQMAMQTTGTPFVGSEMKQKLRERILLERLWDFEVRRNVMVLDSEITQYYEDHIDDFFIPPTYHLRQILFLLKDGEEESQERSRADKVFLLVKSSGNFSELALKYSDGPEAGNGGDLGEVRQDELLDPLAEALKSMKPGDISRPIKTSLGFHIITLDEVTPSRPKELTEVENDIKTRLYQKRSEETFDRWLRELKKKAFIEIKF